MQNMSKMSDCHMIARPGAPTVQRAKQFDISSCKNEFSTTYATAPISIHNPSLNCFHELDDFRCRTDLMVNLMGDAWPPVRLPTANVSNI